MYVWTQRRMDRYDGFTLKKIRDSLSRQGCTPIKDVHPFSCTPVQLQTHKAGHSFSCTPVAKVQQSS